MTDRITLEEYHEMNRTGRLPKRFKKQRSEVLMAVADVDPGLAESAASKRSSKYGAIPTEVDGYRFDSKAEASRYSELKQMMLAGLIANLELQPKYELIVQGVKIGTYSADFRYHDIELGVQVVEDVKSVATVKKELFRWKKKHVKAQYGIEIVEVMI